MKTDLVNRAFVSQPGERKIPVKHAMRLRVGSAQNGGAFELFELAGSGVPQPHVHHDHDECFYIIEGTFTFTVGTEEIEAPAEWVVFVPRGMRHTFKHSEGARALVFVVPAQLENFFRELGEGLAAGRPEAEVRAALAGKYDAWPAK